MPIRPRALEVTIVPKVLDPVDLPVLPPAPKVPKVPKIMEPAAHPVSQLALTPGMEQTGKLNFITKYGYHVWKEATRSLE